MVLKLPSMIHLFPKLLKKCGRRWSCILAHYRLRKGLVQCHNVAVWLCLLIGRVQGWLHNVMLESRLGHCSYEVYNFSFPFKVLTWGRTPLSMLCQFFRRSWIKWGARAIDIAIAVAFVRVLLNLLMYYERCFVTFVPSWGFHWDSHNGLSLISHGMCLRFSYGN